MKGNKLLLLIVVVLAAVAVWLFLDTEETVSDQELRDFAVADTASVDRIFIADHMDRAINLHRAENGEWMVKNVKTGEDFKSQQESVSLLLKTMKRIKVQAPITKASHENIIKQIMSNHAKVEIYKKGEDTPEKIYWVGSPTKDHYGTYMLLEIPGQGRSSVPFIMEMPGFYGFLSTRFHADIYEWRFSGMFNLGIEEIESVSLSFNEEPEKSFRIEQKEPNKFELYSSSTNIPIVGFDEMMAASYLGFYSKIHFERFETRTKQVNVDSVLNTQPMYSLQVKPKDGKILTLDVFRKPNEVPEEDENGTLVSYDTQRMYGLFMDRDFVTLQNQHIDKLFVPLGAFTMGNNVNNSPQ